jgi:hypothetical protein
MVKNPRWIPSFRRNMALSSSGYWIPTFPRNTAMEHDNTVSWKHQLRFYFVGLVEKVLTQWNQSYQLRLLLPTYLYIFNFLLCMCRRANPALSIFINEVLSRVYKTFCQTAFNRNQPVGKTTAAVITHMVLKTYSRWHGRYQSERFTKDTCKRSHKDNSVV